MPENSYSGIWPFLEIHTLNNTFSLIGKSLKNSKQMLFEMTIDNFTEHKKLKKQMPKQKTNMSTFKFSSITINENWI